MHVCPQELFACVLKGCKSRDLEVFLFCLWNEFTVSIMCLRLSIVYFSAYKTELELKLLENLAQILGKYAVIDKIVSPQSAIDDCKLAHFFFYKQLISTCLQI